MCIYVDGILVTANPIAVGSFLKTLHTTSDRAPTETGRVSAAHVFPRQKIRNPGAVGRITFKFTIASERKTRIT